MIKFKKLPLRYMRQHKKRNIMIIIGIALAMALITSITTLSQSLRASVDQRERRSIGDYHLQVRNMPYEKIKYLENNKAVEKIGLIKAEIKWSKDNIKILSGNDEFFRIISEDIEVGTFPKNEDEILISKDAAERINSDFKINETLKLYNKMYKLVGFLDDKSPMTAYVYSKSFNKEDNVDVYVSLYEKLKVREEIERLKNGSLKGYDVIVNEHLFKHMDKMLIGSLNKDSLVIIGVVYILIAITTVVIIYNIFTISIIERVREYGLLRAVGATRKQVMRMVLREGTIIAVVSILIGVFGGIGVIKGVIKVASKNPYSLVNNITFSADYMMILLSIVLGIVTIYLSLMVPAIKAFNITPLDAMDGKNSVIVEKVKKVNQGNISKLIFKGEGFIASKNLRRKKWKFRMSVIAMAISIILFTVVNGLANLVLNSDKISAGEGELTNMNVIISSDKNKDTTKVLSSLSKEIKGENYAERITKEYRPFETEVMVKSDNIGADLKNEFKIKKQDGSTKIKARIQCYNDEAYNNFEKYIETGSAKNIGDENNIIVYQSEKDIGREFDKKRILEYTKLKVGDSVTIKNREFKVVGVLKSLPIGKEDNAWTVRIFGGNHLLSVFQEENEIRLNNLFIKLNENKDKDKIKREIENKVAQYPFLKYQDIDNKMEQVKSGIWEVKFMLYTFICIIAIIATLNIINSIVTGVLTRKKEFATLAAVGMSNRGINKIVLLEGVLQCLTAWVYGTVIGLAIYYGVATLLSRQLEITIVVPFGTIIITILAMIIIVILSTYLPIRCLRNMNITEVLRMQE